MGMCTTSRLSEKQHDEGKEIYTAVLYIEGPKFTIYIYLHLGTTNRREPSFCKQQGIPMAMGERAI